MSSKVGNLEIVHSQLLIIPEGQDAWVEFRVADWDVKLHLVFVDDDDKPNETAYRMTGNDDHALFELRNWKSPLGMAFSEPVEIGSTENVVVSMMAIGHSFNGTMKVDLQFYREDHHE